MPKPKKRTALEVLSKKRLAQLVHEFGLDVPASRPKADLVEAITQAKSASFADVLAQLNRAELKDICLAHDLDDSGKDKASIVDRILGGTSASEAPAPESKRESKPASRGRKSEQPRVIEEIEEPAGNGKMTLQKLESHLWGAANILRGAIDAADFKHYIFGLLFYKRLCDVWQEEYEQRLAEFGDEDMAADPEEHRFDIPSDHAWDDVRKHSTNIGEHLNNAFHAIEDVNLRLRGVFQDVDFNNKERFPDTVLERLLQHFEKFRLRHEDVEDDVLGNAYEYLIAKFADDAGKKGGEFYTPKMVVRLMVECLAPEEGMSVYDPTCGSGGMLLEALAYLKRHGKDRRALTLYGQERNLNTWAICKMNMFLHGIDDVFIERGDTLRDPKHLASEGSKVLMTFDRVLANPPFSLKEWGHEQWSKGDKFGRDKFGCPPASYGDLAFVQHMVASLKSGGSMAVVLPHGVLFRGGAEGTIRQGLLEQDLIEAVIGLGANLFYGTGIPACVLICRRDKPKARQGKVLFVNGAAELVEGRNQNHLSETNVGRLAKGFTSYKDEDGFARIVGIEEITKNEFNLNISRYLQNGDEAEEINVAAEVQKLNRLRSTRDDAEARMMGFLKELGYGDA